MTLRGWISLQYAVAPRSCRLILLLGTLIATPLAFGASESEPSTSPNARGVGGAAPKQVQKGAVLITFSEFPVGTAITDQYSDQGILFGGDSPFISTDGANPTSPVLSGTPIFEGAIEGYFVDPNDGITPIPISGFSLDAGYFDAIGSVRLRWFDVEGNVLGQRANTVFGIETFVIEGTSIAKWRIEILKEEPAGFAVDNVSFDNEITSSILFREKSDGEKDGTWGFGDDEIPGFDHSAFHLDDKVYESHPGYPTGTYVDKFNTESVHIVAKNGVQSQHSRGTFEHDARASETSPVIDFDELVIARDLAVNMETVIKTRLGASFQLIDFGSPEGLDATLSPSAQKGGGGSFTCVGLVEWAAEQAGHNDGQGFIKNSFESFEYPVGVFPVETRTAPLLSPQLLNYSMKLAEKINSAKQWFQGFFDPVDFLVVDPLGRRMGHTEALGEVNEIPGAFYSGNGNLEQFFIPNPLPGEYRVELSGLDKKVVGAVNCASEGQSVVEAVDEFLPQDEPMNLEIIVESVPGSPGDLDGDGDVDSDDLAILLGRLNTFVNDPNDPADINGDGVINTEDADLLPTLCGRPNCLTKPESIFSDGFESGNLSAWSGFLN